MSMEKEPKPEQPKKDAFDLEAEKFFHEEDKKMEKMTDELYEAYIIDRLNKYLLEMIKDDYYAKMSVAKISEQWQVHHQKKFLALLEHYLKEGILSENMNIQKAMEIMDKRKFELLDTEPEDDPEEGDEWKTR